MDPGRRPRVLFLCTGNSCRSQIAEGLMRSLYGDRYDVFSAGTRPAAGHGWPSAEGDRDVRPSAAVHPWAVRAMREIDIDISGRRAKSIADLPGAPFDIVVTVCDNAHRECVSLPARSRRIHWPIPDPAAAGGTQREIESAFRRARELIRENLLAEFGKP
ncbi:MAG: hypothetical protein A3G34_12235 [Candidatus Lindowbacteria bacterium RIFCSPLOWO2_12_FULL_62_27]|nr:MAG: hypothetical protein A3G34_12235 [Candidatus Lindowbacteria bacterium RIFCSPLOWO2_12_FULL_62_27]OGH63534.1 MAG: hypothetical protein A3I06_05150 [Candidatus Lindowbacteria bacterium RIFCSPLOWO2_02_FULL_62_12]